ncbi:MAG: prepilin-type N-terminal cleavage/methylation domain-containing protein, partial [Desulfobacterales bacterium]|nr:prepilin-type N-terminal cleavage/methylation domain-containing protein [Desulfobacterales bacterium]
MAIARQKNGFTLLEILVAMFIFSAVVTTLFTAYRALFFDTDQFESSLHRHAMAQACLMRMVNDLGALHMQLPPLYTRPDFNDPPGDDRIVGEQPDRLRFTSLAHLPMDRSRREGLAEIRYYVHTGDDGKPVLRRSDTVYPYPPFEEKATDPVLCEDVKKL